METIHYLGLAYLIIWALLGFFGLSIYSKQNKITTEIEDLKERLDFKANK